MPSAGQHTAPDRHGETRQVDGLAPKTGREPVVDLHHGVSVADPYRWLEDGRSPQTVRWSAEQDTHWISVRGALHRLPWWRDQVATFLDIDFASTSISRGSTTFTMRHTTGAARPGLYAQGPQGEAVDLLGALPKEFARAGVVSAWQPSYEGERLALALARGASEEPCLYLVDARTGAFLDGPIEGCAHTSITWLSGGAALYYTRRDAVYLHRVGSPVEDDVRVFASSDPGEQYYSLGMSRDGRWLSVSASDGSPVTGNSLWLGELCGERHAGFRRVQAADEATSGITFGPDGLLYILTDLGAPNRRIMVASPEQPERPHWRELVASDPEATITDFAIPRGAGSGSLLVAWLRDAVGEMSVHDLADGTRRAQVPLPGLGKVGPLVAGPDGTVGFSYEEFTAPRRTLMYHVPTRTLSPAAPAKSPDVQVPTETVRHQCRSVDGTSVQMIVVKPAGAQGPMPTILCGYGGFGVSMTPRYSGALMAWVAAGGSFVTANVRGGGERGERWHDAGRRLRKQNAFDDFAACARTLIDTGLTSPDRLAIWGGSNGGLLVAAALTQWPELFAAAVAFAPLCDMLRYEQSALGAVWRPEYGSVADAQDFRNLLAYSPYHRVEPGRRYPATLFAVSDADERVDPMHARKMCAALQHASSAPAPVVLRRDDREGHSHRPKDSMINLTADILAFIATHTGWDPTCAGAEPSAGDFELRAGRKEP